MPKTPREVAGFVILPVSLQSPLSKKPVKHYLYLKPHEPAVPDETATRSLFLVNIPICTSVIHLRHFFASQLSAGRVERVEFTETTNRPTSRTSRKRKRLTAEEIETSLETRTLPSTLPSEIHASGSTAIVIFVDRTSRDLSLRAARRAAKQNETITWGEGIPEHKLPKTGISRYEAHNVLQYPDRTQLLRLVADYMTAYSALEEARTQENARKTTTPDEDGFVTVTRGSKGALRRDEAQELGEKKKAKDKSRVVEDFYRFQTREKRREQHNEMLQRFQQEKRKVEELRARRGNVRPER